jgi:hypothetical protein
LPAAPLAADATATEATAFMKWVRHFATEISSIVRFAITERRRPRAKPVVAPRYRRGVADGAEPDDPTSEDPES